MRKILASLKEIIRKKKIVGLVAFLFLFLTTFLTIYQVRQQQVYVGQVHDTLHDIRWVEPSNLSAEQVSPTEWKFSWTLERYITTRQLLRIDSNKSEVETGCPNGCLIKTGDNDELGKSTTYTATNLNLVAGTTYYLRVVSYRDPNNYADAMISFVPVPPRLTIVPSCVPLTFSATTDKGDIKIVTPGVTIISLIVRPDVDKVRIRIRENKIGPGPINDPNDLRNNLITRQNGYLTNIPAARFKDIGGGNRKISWGIGLGVNPDTLTYDVQVELQYVGMPGEWCQNGFSEVGPGGGNIYFIQPVDTPLCKVQKCFQRFARAPRPT